MLTIPFPRNATLANSIIIFVGLIGILYFGEDVILPFVIAGILTVVLLPGVSFLVTVKVPKQLAILIAVLTALGVVLVTGSLVGRTAMQIISDLPKYEEQLKQKADALKSATSGSAYTNAARVIQHLQDDIAASPKPDSLQVAPATQNQPDSSNFTGFSWAKSAFGAIAHPFLQLATIFVLLTFMLLYHEELRDRLILLGGSYDLRHTTLAVNDTAKRLSRLMLGILSINLAVGVVIGGALWILGVPGALMWGLLTTLLRFVPFVGTFVASAFPILTALAVGEGWSLAVEVAAIITVTEFLAAQVLEPVVLGRMSGLWPPALIAAALFWVAVWGPVGLIVSTPITICLLALSQHIRAWQPLAVLLGEQSVLAPGDSFYGRLIVGDTAGITVLASKVEEEPERFLVDVAVPAIRRVSHDIDTGEVDRTQLQDIKETLHEALEVIAPNEESNTPNPLLIVAAHGLVNYCAALIFAALLRSRDIPNTVVRLGEVPKVKTRLKSAAARPVLLASLVPLEKRVASIIARRIKDVLGNSSVRQVSWVNAEGEVESPEAFSFELPRTPAKSRKKPLSLEVAASFGQTARAD